MFVVWEFRCIFVLLKGKRRSEWTAKKREKKSRKVLRFQKLPVPLRHQSFTQKNKHHEVQFKINGNS
jgi:hypothetical protein